MTLNRFEIDSPKIRDRVVAKNTLAFAFPSYMPIVPGHMLVCPFRVVQDCDDLTHEEWRAIMELKKMLCASLKMAFEVDGFNFAWNKGELAGQSVPHFHLHIVPRKQGDTGIYQYEPRQFLYRPGSRAITPDEELNEIACLIRNHFQALS